MQQDESQKGSKMEITEAIRTMNEANKIYEDFPNSKYALYLILFTIQIALAFWVALKLL
jgi:hypothetical protein